MNSANLPFEREEACRVQILLICPWKSVGGGAGEFKVISFTSCRIDAPPGKLE